MAERDDYRNCCEALTLERQCILRLAAEAEELREKSADRERADAALKTAPKGGGKKRATAADKRVAILRTKLANA